MEMNMKGIALMGFAFLAGVAIVAVGCGSGTWSGASSRCERAVDVSAPAATPTMIVAATENGAVNVVGIEGDQCKVHAKIQAWASSAEAARTLAEAVSVTIEAAGEKLLVKIDKPASTPNTGVQVDLDIQATAKCNLDLTSQNGGIEVSAIQGSTKAVTQNGSIRAKGISGDCRATSQNGQITVDYAKAAPAVTCEMTSQNGSVECSGAVGRISGVSQNGSVTLSQAGLTGGEQDVNLEAHNGEVVCTLPNDPSGNLDASAQNGQVQVECPMKIEVKGAIDRTLHGILGDGKGSIRLKTHNGSVTIR
jgi:DUF4097 and DUF4098 domain-containing protein YvlB